MEKAETTTTAPARGCPLPPPPEAQARKHKKCRTLADIENDPRVDEVLIEDHDGTKYFLYLKGSPRGGVEWHWYDDDFSSLIAERTIKELCWWMNNAIELRYGKDMAWRCDGNGKNIFHDSWHG